jgi:trk system potassium uptake protein TrkH
VQAVLSIIGMLLGGLAVAMLLPALADPEHALRFLASAGITGLAAGWVYFSAPRDSRNKIGVREAYLLTSLAWLSLTVFAALPLKLSGLTMTDAVFESVSGLTTTGSTVLTDLDEWSEAILLWRALLQWVGGIGIIVTSIAILPLLRVGGMQLFRTESSQSAKELPRAAKLATETLWVYGALSALCAMSYWIAGMSGFDAITHAMTTVSTGGFSTHDASLGYFRSDIIEWIAVLFMLAGGIPFVLYIRAYHHRPIKSVQVKSLFIFLGVTIAVLTAWLLGRTEMNTVDAVTEVVFNVVSVVTTTGFATADYTSWGAFAVAVFFVLTFSGACTGSTSGGLKIMRSLVALKMCRLEIRKGAHPHGVFREKYEDTTLTGEVMSSVGMFMFIFFGSIAALGVALQLIGLDFVTAFSGAATAIANVGPGLGPTIGPAGNFATLPDVAKWLLSIGMLFGRLEFLTLLVLVTPAFWRR